MVFLYQLKMSEAISQGFKLLHIPCYLYAVLSHEVPDVDICAQRGPQHFDALYREHHCSEVIRNALKVRVILKKMLSRFVDMPSGRALCQDHSLAHIKVQVTVCLEYWLAYSCRT